MLPLSSTLWSWMANGKPSVWPVANLHQSAFVRELREPLVNGERLSRLGRKVDSNW